MSNIPHFLLRPASAALAVVVLCQSSWVLPAAAAPATGRPVVKLSAVEDAVRGLEDLEERAGRLAPDERNFVLGYAHYRRGRWKEAAELFGQIEHPSSLAADHLLFYRAVCMNRLGDGARAISSLEELMRAAPESVWSSQARLEKGRALLSLDRFREARAALENARRTADGGGAFEAGLLILQAMIGEGAAPEAISQARALAVGADSESRLAELSPAIGEIGRRFGEDVAAWLTEPEQQLALAGSFAARSQWDEAAARLAKLVARRPGGDLSARARWLLARACRSLGRFGEAVRLLEGLEKEGGASVPLEEIRELLATTYTKDGAIGKALTLRQRMMEGAAPGSSEAARMAYKIAFLTMDEGRYEEAIPLWRRAQASGGWKRGVAEWYLAWCHYRAGKSEEAAALFERMLQGRSKRDDLHDRILYWKGRALEKLGRESQARAAWGELERDHPHGYYARLARQRLRGEEGKAEIFSPAVQPLDSWEEPAAPGPAQGSGHLARAIFFDRLGLREEAARELRAAGGGDGGAAERIAERSFAHDVACRRAEGAHRAFLKSAPTGSGPRSVWEAAYPRAYDPAVTRLAKGSPLDPRLVWAIMRNESFFRPEVVSPAGAVGLLQLMPATANRVAADVGRGQIDRRELEDPAVNIALGVAYLKRLARLFPDHPAAWIASYNAGEEAVGRWIASDRTDDVEEWIEEIPYDETNLYVKKVLVSLWRYRELYR